MRISKSALLATILIFAASAVSAATIQSDGILTLTSKVVIDSPFDAQVSDVRFASLDSHDAAVFSPSSVFEFRTTELTPLRVDDKQATFAFLVTNRITAQLGKRHEVGWRM